MEATPRRREALIRIFGCIIFYMCGGLYSGHCCAVSWHYVTWRTRSQQFTSWTRQSSHWSVVVQTASGRRSSTNSERWTTCTASYRCSHVTRHTCSPTSTDRWDSWLIDASNCETFRIDLPINLARIFHSYPLCESRSCLRCLQSWAIINCIIVMLYFLLGICYSLY